MRTFNYESEKKCDAHVGIFLKALDAAKTLPGQGFAAIKVRCAARSWLVWNLRTANVGVPARVLDAAQTLPRQGVAAVDPLFLREM